MAKKKVGRKKIDAHHSPDEIKNRILVCAKQHFAVHGYLGANLKDIAKCAKVAGSLVNYHFRDKEGLFKATLEIFAKNRMAVINRILEIEPKSFEEMKTRIELFVDEMLLSYVEDPNGFLLINSEIKAQNPLALKIFQETFLQSFENACRFITNAKSSKLINKDFDPLILASLLFSLTCETAQNDHLGLQFYNVTISNNDWRRKVSKNIVNLFLNGVSA